MATTQRERSVISVGTIPQLLSLRAAILESAGYRVFSALQLHEAASFIKKQNCGALLICYSVPERWCCDLIQKFREYCPTATL